MTQRCQSLRLFIVLLTFVSATASGVIASSEISIQSRSAQFDRIEAKLGATDQSDLEVASRVRQAYKSLFGPLQTAGSVRKLNDADLSLLFRAASNAQFYTEDLPFVRDMQIDLNALRARGRALQVQYIKLNDALISSRLFSEARTLEHAHPGTAVQRVHSSNGDVSIPVAMVLAPTLRDETEGRAGPSAMFLRTNGRVLIRRNVRISAPAQIIVVISPWCEFAQAGIQDIQADSRLRRAFAEHAIWLVPSSEAAHFDAIAQWNQAHPREAMSIAYKTEEWRILDQWGTPTFYFLRKGNVVAKVIGWPPGGHKPEIRSALNQIDLL